MLLHIIILNNPYSGVMRWIWSLLHIMLDILNKIGKNSWQSLLLWRFNMNMLQNEIITRIVILILLININLFPWTPILQGGPLKWSIFHFILQFMFYDIGERYKNTLKKNENKKHGILRTFDISYIYTDYFCSKFHIYKWTREYFEMKGIVVKWFRVSSILVEYYFILSITISIHCSSHWFFLIEVIEYCMHVAKIFLLTGTSFYPYLA